jgi:hypothetical protein
MMSVFQRIVLEYKKPADSPKLRSVAMLSDRFPDSVGEMTRGSGRG